MTLISQIHRLLVLLPMLAILPHTLTAMPGASNFTPGVKAGPAVSHYGHHSFTPVETGHIVARPKPGYFKQYTVSGASGRNFITSAESTLPESPPAGISASDLRVSRGIHSPRYVDLAEVDANAESSGFLNSIGNSPGYAFLASALVPGLGQAANDQWWKTAFFVAVEAAAIGFYIHRENRGRDGERYYQEFGDENWSVVKYAQYIVDEHGDQHQFEFRELLSDAGKEQYDANGAIVPEFDTQQDWPVIDINALREAERNSQYGNGETFSHTLHDYGSQQYYELMSKYFQFGPGWAGWDTNSHNVDNAIMPDDFWYHAGIGYDFNTDLNTARNMITILITNHFVSAFDAYFTQLLREARVSPAASMEFGHQPTFGFNYRF